MSALHLTAEDFEQNVLNSSEPVLVDFWAEWCNPCRMLAPVIDELAAELDGKATVAKVNIDECGDLAMRYGVMSIPTIIAFKNGKEAGRQVGVVPKQNILALLD